MTESDLIHRNAIISLNRTSAELSLDCLSGSACHPGPCHLSPRPPSWATTSLKVAGWLLETQMSHYLQDNIQNLLPLSLSLLLYQGGDFFLKFCPHPWPGDFPFHHTCQNWVHRWGVRTATTAHPINQEERERPAEK